MNVKKVKLIIKNMELLIESLKLEIEDEENLDHQTIKIEDIFPSPLNAQPEFIDNYDPEYYEEP